MMPIEDNKACLELILGPMFAGKTSRLIKIYNHCNQNKIPIYVINHSFDKRYSENQLTTHDKISIPSINIQNLYDLFESDYEKSCIISSKVILINEGQFFNDLKNFVIELLEKYNKKVYVCGLDGDFKRNKFGNILDLIPFCDTITKLHAKCNICNDCALFSHRKLKNDDQVLVGSNDAYESLCRNCYLKHKS